MSDDTREGRMVLVPEEMAEPLRDFIREAIEQLRVLEYQDFTTCAPLPEEGAAQIEAAEWLLRRLDGN